MITKIFVFIFVDEEGDDNDPFLNLLEGGKKG